MTTSCRRSAVVASWVTAAMLSATGRAAPPAAADAGSREPSAPQAAVAAPGVVAPAALADIRITLRGSDLPLGAVINQIARSARLSPVVDKEVRVEVRVPSTDFDGTPLDAALAVLLTPLGYSYEVDLERRFLRIFVYASRTFRVAIPAVVQSWSASISNSGSEGGAGITTGGAGAMGAKIALSTRTETAGLWEEVERSLGRLLQGSVEPGGAGGSGGTGGAPAREVAAKASDLGSFSANRVAGFVVVRALPSVMPAVEAYFSALNAEMGRTVTIETKVLQVDLHDDKAGGVDWNLAALSLGKLFVGAGSQLSALSNNAIIGGRTANAAAPVLQLSGRAGEAFVRALQQQGTVNVLAQPTLALGNNMSSVIELADIRAYVYQLTTTVVQGTAAAQTTVQTSSLSDGLLISVMPRVLENGEVSLAIGLILQDVVSIDPFSFSGGAVQLPHTSRRSYSGVMRARVGESLVLGGLLTSRKEDRTSGIPFLSRLPIIGGLFGTIQRVDRKSELVLTVTPRAVQSVGVAAAGDAPSP